MAFYKIITNQGSVVFKQASNKFQLLSWFRQTFENKLMHKAIVQVNESDFKFPVSVVEPITGVQVVGCYTLDEIDLVLQGCVPGQCKKIATDVSNGEVVSVTNHEQNTVLKINSVEPFPVLDESYLQKVMMC